MGRYALPVIVVGAGISGLTVAHAAHRAGADVTVLEADAVAGGKLRASERSGYLLDHGPNGFVSNVPDTLELVRELGLEGDLRPASERAQRRYLYWAGALRPLPTSPGDFLRSEFLSVPGKLRALAEPLVLHRTKREESVHDFVARHFGFEAARVFSGPLVQGITAGDPRQLSLDALFPRFRALERSHGSLLRGLGAARRGARNGAPRLTSFAGGMARLPEALARALGDRVRTSGAVVEVRPRGPGGGTGAQVVLADGTLLEADRVVLATPAHAAASILRAAAPDVAAALDGIRYVDIHVVGLGYHRIDVAHPLDGFGFLVPRGGRVRCLGVLWSSSLYPDHAPAERVALRALYGGAFDPGFGDLTDDEALAAVRRDLEITLGITSDPEWVDVVRWRRGIPQFTLGHRERVAAAREALAKALPRVRLVGNYLDGVGVNDAVRTARATARELLAGTD